MPTPRHHGGRCFAAVFEVAPTEAWCRTLVRPPSGAQRLRIVSRSTSWTPRVGRGAGVVSHLQNVLWDCARDRRRASEGNREGGGRGGVARHAHALIASSVRHSSTQGAGIVLSTQASVIVETACTRGDCGDVSMRKGDEQGGATQSQSRGRQRKVRLRTTRFLEPWRSGDSIA